MKIIYYSHPFFADCDFPLVKELQEKGIDVRCYMSIKYKFLRSNIIEFQKPCRRWGIYKASRFADMKLYSSCIDLDRLYFICGDISRKWMPSSWLLWAFVFIHMLLQRADVMHITWQFVGREKILKRIPFFKKRVMTVHDPIQHSDIKGYEANENERIDSFKWADRYMLLNSGQVELFSKTYNIDRKRIMVSGLGAYNSILHVNQEGMMPIWDKPYILYFGQITPHKGIEYLLEAMKEVHKVNPEVGLIIAGGGKLYFDYSPYKDLNYVRLLNYYIGVKELVGLIRYSLFTICPYKDATQSGVVQTSLVLEKPTIVTRVGALPEMVKEGLYGIVVSPCSAQSLSDAICELLNHPEKRSQMVDNIKKQWIPSMAWDNIAEKYIELYKS